MSRLLIAPVARADLEEIWAYYAIELQNSGVADRIMDEFFTAFRRIARTPGVGHLRRDLTAEPVRFLRVRNFLIIYRSEKRPLEIVRILHGRRNITAILGS